LFGVFPPGHRNWRETFSVVGGLLRGHAAAVAAIRAIDPTLAVGLVHQVRLFEPARPTLADRAAAAVRDTLFNGIVLRSLSGERRLAALVGLRPSEAAALRGTCDFVGVNYYTRERIAFDWRAPGGFFGRAVRNPNSEWSDCGRDGQPYGEIYPEGLYRTLVRCSALGVPLYVTETGLLYPPARGGCPSCHPRRGRCARPLLVDAGRQFRVGRGVGAALRPLRARRTYGRAATAPLGPALRLNRARQCPLGPASAVTKQCRRAGSSTGGRAVYETALGAGANRRRWNWAA
jgi:hypothetical protein